MFKELFEKAKDVVFITTIVIGFMILLLTGEAHNLFGDNLDMWTKLCGAAVVAVGWQHFRPRHGADDTKAKQEAVFFAASAVFLVALYYQSPFPVIAGIVYGIFALYNRTRH